MLTICPECEGFIPDAAGRCPNCDARPTSLGRRAAKLAACGAMMMTLMACYGGPTMMQRPPAQPPEQPQGHECMSAGADLPADGSEAHTACAPLPSNTPGNTPPPSATIATDPAAPGPPPH